MADQEVGNLVVQLGMDDTGLNRSLAALDRQMKLVQSEFRVANTKLGEFGQGTEGLRIKSDSLTKQIEIQRQRVAELAKRHAESAKEKGEDAKETQKLEVRLNRAQAELNGMQNELKTVNDEIKKQTSSWGQYSKQLGDFGEQAQKIGKQFSDVGKALTKSITVPLAAIGGTATKTFIDFESAFAGVNSCPLY